MPHTFWGAKVVRMCAPGPTTWAARALSDHSLKAVGAMQRLRAHLAGGALHVLQQKMWWKGCTRECVRGSVHVNVDLYTWDVNMLVWKIGMYVMMQQTILGPYQKCTLLA